MQTAPKDVTVAAVIPCYNGERFIGGAIEHLQKQTRPPDELIVVDDGSTDRSSEIIASYSGVKVIRHSVNRGLPAGRNHAWQAAGCTIVAYVDVDAYAEPEFLERLLEAYDSEDVAAVGGAGHEVRGHPASNAWRQRFLAQNYGPERREDVKFLFGIASSFRRRVLQEVGGFDPAFRTNGEDVDLCLRLRAAGYRLVYTPHARVHHHRDDTLRSLLAMIHRWWVWGHRAHLKNGVPYLGGHLIDTLRMMRWVSLRCIRELKPRLMLINLLFFPVALHAIVRARRLGPPAVEPEENRA